MMNAGKIAQYVWRGNEIEGISEPLGRPEWDQHFQVVSLVLGVNVPVDSRYIHRVLMRGLMPEVWHMEGEYRREDAYYGSEKMVHPDHVACLMDERVRMVADVVRTADMLDVSILETRLEELFFLAQIIHPYPDGNGRTFRLELNNLRQCCGLPWLMYEEEGWQKLLERLRAYEQQYRKYNPHHYRPKAKSTPVTT